VDKSSQKGSATLAEKVLLSVGFARYLKNLKSFCFGDFMHFDVDNLCKMWKTMWITHPKRPFVSIKASFVT